MKFSSRTWLLLGILYTGYIVYGTLLPFNFSFSFELIQSNLGNIEWIEEYGQSFFSTKNIDAIVNIHLYHFLVFKNCSFTLFKISCFSFLLG